MNNRRLLWRFPLTHWIGNIQIFCRRHLQIFFVAKMSYLLLLSLNRPTVYLPLSKPTMIKFIDPNDILLTIFDKVILQEECIVTCLATPRPHPKPMWTWHPSDDKWWWKFTNFENVIAVHQTKSENYAGNLIHLSRGVEQEQCHNLK